MRGPAEETPEKRILNRISAACGRRLDDADCRRCIKVAQRAVEGANSVRLLSAATRRDLTNQALNGLETMTRAVRAGACSPIPGLDGERLRECVKTYKKLRPLMSLKRRRSRGENRRAAAVYWAHSLLVRYGITPTVYEAGDWHFVARQLYGGDGSPDLFQAIRDYRAGKRHPVNDVVTLYGVVALRADGTWGWPDPFDPFDDVHVRFTPTNWISV
jgi:hypothetical protein